MDLLRCISLYISAFAHYLFDRRSGKGIAFGGLIQHHSYRLDQRAHSDLLIGLRYWVRAVRLIFDSRENNYPGNPDSHSLIFDDTLNSAKERLEYVQAITRELPRAVVARAESGLRISLFQRIIETVFISSLGLILFPLSLFIRGRASLALNLLELVECARLLQKCRRLKASKVYFFCAFNKDSNFIALALRNAGINCHKVPSSNPLKNFYREVISDVFSFTAPFQEAEYQELKANWKVKELVHWPVFRFQTIHPLLSAYRQAPSNTLVFISSAIWKRMERGDLALGVGETEAELRVIRFLQHFLPAHPEVKFSIFFHPLEKSSPEVYEKACSHYRKLFEGVTVDFYPAEVPTFRLFDRADLSIAAYSSTNLERLYAGFKTLYAPLGMRRDYYAGSALEHIAAFEEVELGDLILKALGQSNAEFFESNQLYPYHHQSFIRLHPGH